MRDGASLVITVTGPTGNIGYALLFRLAAGVLGDCPVHLKLLVRDTPESLKRGQGVAMELTDCAFPLLDKVTIHTDAKEAFTNANVVFMVGAAPRQAGMTRADLLHANAALFKAQGQALNEAAPKDVRVVVVGNPCNTNALIVAKAAPAIPRANITALMRLDENRTRSQVGELLGTPPKTLSHVTVWGNHADTMVVDVDSMTVDANVNTEALTETYLRETLNPRVAKRGSEIIQVRGASSAASAAAAALDHMRDWLQGSDWCTMAVPSEGQYGVPAGLVFGFPCRCVGGTYEIIDDLVLSERVKAGIQQNITALENERDAAMAFLGES